MSFGKFERTANTNSAVSEALDFAKKNNLKIEYNSVGVFLKTSNCKIFDESGYFTEGRGKGLEEQSIASAIFEAIEHYFYFTEDINSNGDLMELNLKDTDNKLNDISPDFNLICRDKKIILRRLSFSRIDDENDNLLYPAILTNPFYRSNNINEQNDICSYRLNRYATNSGTASGLNKNEALLHALLETIERDGIAIELLRTIIRKNPFPVREINVNTLPDDLKTLYDSACKESNGNIKLYNITSDVGIPTILSGLSVGNPIEYCFYGSGSSLSVHYATERAILESVQGFHIQNEYNVTLQKPIKEFFEGMSLYQRCNLSEGYFLYRGGKSIIDFFDIKNPLKYNNDISVEFQINFIVNILKDLGMDVYYRTIFENTISVIQVIVPQFDRFHLVSNGVLVAPSNRGKKFLTDSNL